MLIWIMLFLSRLSRDVWPTSSPAERYWESIVDLHRDALTTWSDANITDLDVVLLTWRRLHILSPP